MRASDQIKVKSPILKVLNNLGVCMTIRNIIDKHFDLIVCTYLRKIFFVAVILEGNLLLLVYRNNFHWYCEAFAYLLWVSSSKTLRQNTILQYKKKKKKMVYAQPSSCPGEWNTQTPMGLWHTNVIFWPSTRPKMPFKVMHWKELTHSNGS